VRSFVPVFQALSNNADAALETNPWRFEKWHLARILRIQFPLSDCATSVVPEHGFLPAGHAWLPFLKHKCALMVPSRA